MKSLMAVFNILQFSCVYLLKICFDVGTKKFKYFLRLWINLIIKNLDTSTLDRVMKIIIVTVDHATCR